VIVELEKAMETATAPAVASRDLFALERPVVFIVLL
jgi:hypothetical protein